MLRRWFSVSLLFENVSDPNPHTRLWEESIIVVNEDDEENARVKAEKIGKAREVTFETCTGGYADWRFRYIERVYDLGDIDFKHGTEVFSRHLRASEVNSILTPF